MGPEYQFNSRPGFWKEAALYLDLLYNFAIRITGTEKIAYKLLKETYEKAFRFYSHLDESIIFDKWMLRIMKNTYLETFSSKLYIQKIDYEKIQIEFSKLESIDFERLKKDIFGKLTEKEITGLFASMPDEYKMVIVCNSTLGFTYDEIVEFIDILPGIVRLRIHRGRKILFILLYNYALDKGYIKRLKEDIPKEIKENRDYYFIAALADDELKNTPEETKTKESINKENELLFEYNIQVMIKQILTKKLNNLSTPPGIKNKIERKFSLRA